MRQSGMNCCILFLVVVVEFTANSATRAALPSLSPILEEAAGRRGILVHLGCDDGGRSLELQDDGRFVVQALDRDAGKVARARDYLRSRQAYGPVSVNVLNGTALPFVDNLVNVLVVDDDMGVSQAEMLRVVSPLGVAWVRNGESDEWVKIVKPWPETMDEWTHFLHDASGNAVSTDETVGPPRRLQWTGGPLWTRSHEFNNSMPAMVTARGRLFYIFDFGLTGMEDERLPEKWTLVARDAFNGSLLWKRELSSWGSDEWSSRALRFFRGNMARRLVAAGDRVYVTFDYGKGVEILDAATGQSLGTAPGTEGAEEILVANDQLFCLSQVQPRRPGAHVRITRFDIDSGEVAWQVRDARYIPQLTCLESGAVVYHNTEEIICLNGDDGSVRWRVDDRRSAGARDNMLLISDGVVLASSSEEIAAVSLEAGDILWRAPGATGKSMQAQDMFVVRGQVFVNGSDNIIAGYDLKTGERTAAIDPTSVQSQGHHLRCYRAKATENYLITQFRGVEFLGLDDQLADTQNDWLRGSCTYGVMPANGFLYQPPHSCFCFAAAMQKGFNAFAGPLEPAAVNQPITDDPGPLEEGPAYGSIAETRPDAKAWNSYRHDERRSGATGERVSGALDRRWKVSFGVDISPPVAADDRVFIAAKSRHTIYALDARTGEEQWSFAGGGPIDSPPSIHRGLLVFGCADGYAYCVRANDGALAWRRRLAPAERWMASHGQLESVWRLHGSVAVVDDLAYCIAGRSSFVDGGLFLTAVDIQTGDIKYRSNLYTASNEREDRKLNEFVASYHIEGAHSDLLVAEGGYIYLNQMKFAPDLSLQPVDYLSKEQVTARPSLNLDNQDYVNEDIFNVQWRNTRYDTYDKLAGILVDEGESVGESDVGLHMFTTSGFLDTSFFNRTYWMYSKTWPGFNMTNLAPKSGQLVVVGPETTYALKAFTSRFPLTPSYTPQTKGYLLIADENDNEPTLDPRAWGKDKGMGFSRGVPPLWHRWVPVRVTAMVLGGDQLIACGPPDVVDEDDPLAAFEGRLGSELWVLSAADGSIISQMKLEETPIFDGMIVADDRLYLCTRAGDVICMGSE